jgi:hypothetical protein
LNHFDKSFIGLTGSGAEVKAAEVAAKVPSGSAAEHTAFVLAYTKDNLGHVIKIRRLLLRQTGCTICPNSPARRGQAANRASCGPHVPGPYI